MKYNPSEIPELDTIFASQGIDFQNILKQTLQKWLNLDELLALSSL